MDWIAAIQKAIDYVEDNLTKEIDYEEIAKQVYFSSFYFQKIFKIICGFSLSDYIRMRRLSLAAIEIIESNAKITDIALKYGYDSLESFTRAFTKFHNSTPTKVRSSHNIKSFSRLSVKIIISGGNTMDYRIEKLDNFKVACKRKKVIKPGKVETAIEIKEFWKNCTMNGSIQKVLKVMSKNPKLKGLLGIGFSSQLEGSKFPYGIGVEYSGEEINDKDIEIVDIPANTYAVFTCKGKMPEAFKNTYHKIATEFFPQNTNYAYANSVEFEVYPSDDISNPNYTCEIWVAVKEK